MKDKEIFSNIDLRASSGDTAEYFKSGNNTHKGYKIGIIWKVNSQSTSSNSSNVTVSMYIHSQGSSYSINSTATKNFSITINGTKYTATGTVGLKGNEKKTLMSKTVNVGHDSNGSKTCSLACSAGVEVTLSGVKYGTVSHSTSAAFDKINLNTPPSMSGSLNISPSGTIPENTGTINLSWTKASDSQNNGNKYQIYRYVNGTHDKTFNIGSINTVSYADSSVGGFAQGTKFYYKIWAGDTYDTWSNALTSATVTKNTMSVATLNSGSSITGTGTISFSWNAASNTNGTSIAYDLTADGVPIYNATGFTGTNTNVAIVTSSQSGPYILLNDIKNKFAGANFAGSLTFTLTTRNSYGTKKTSTKAISVNLKKPPTAASVSISTTASESTAYVQPPNQSGWYFLPDGSKKIRIKWSGGSDYLGQALKYDVQYKLGDAGFVNAASNQTGSYYDLVVPKQNQQLNLIARVITKTNYGTTASKDSSTIKVEYYNAPTAELISLNRTATTAEATVRLKKNTSITAIPLTGRYAGLSSGNLANSTDNQKFSKSGLTDGGTYTWTVYVKDNAWSTSEKSITVNVPGATPLFAIREKGVGVNFIPDSSSYKLYVGGGARISGTTRVDKFGQNGGAVTDFNNALTEGEYHVGASSTTGGPYSGTIYGKLKVTVNDGGTHNNSSNWIWQVFHDTSGRYYRRNKVNGGGWTGWKLDGDITNLTRIHMKAPNGSCNKDVIKTHNGDSNGMGITMEGGGALVLGGGESAVTYMNTLSNKAAENAYLTADGSVVLVSGCQDMSNKKEAVFGGGLFVVNTGATSSSTGIKVQGSSHSMSLWCGTGGTVVQSNGGANLHLGQNNTTDMIFYSDRVEVKKRFKLLQNKLEVDAAPANNNAHMTIYTAGDGNGQGDGNTHIGYNSNGVMHHYFRGKGKMNINTSEGAYVSNRVQTPLVYADKIWLGTYNDTWYPVEFYRSMNGGNRLGKIGLSGGNIKLASSSSQSFVWGPFIESNNSDGSAARRYGFTNLAFYPANDNASFLGCSTHRWKSAYCTEGKFYTSTKSAKTNIVNIDSDATTFASTKSNKTTKDYILTAIKETPMVVYNYKTRMHNDENATNVADNPMFLGFIADDLEKNHPEFFELIGEKAIHEREDENGEISKDMQYDISDVSMLGALWTGLQEALNKIDTLENKIKTLEGENNVQ